MSIATSTGTLFQNPAISKFTNGSNAVYNVTNQYVISTIVNLGLAGLKLDIEGDLTLQENSEITDHYTEAGYPIQDNVVFNPIRYTLTGKIGETVIYAKNNEPSNFQQLTQKLTKFNSFIPTLTGGMQQLQNTANQLATSQQSTADYAKAAIGASTNFYKTFKQLNPPRTKQADAVNFIRSLKNSKSLINLETPWMLLSNLLIETLEFTQPAESKDYTDVTITLKEIRFAKVEYTKFDSSKYQGRSQNQASATTVVGKAGGTILSNLQKGNLVSALKAGYNSGTSAVQSFFSPNVALPNNKPKTPYSFL